MHPRYWFVALFQWIRKKRQNVKQKSNVRRIETQSLCGLSSRPLSRLRSHLSGLPLADSAPHSLLKQWLVSWLRCSRRLWWLWWLWCNSYDSLIVAVSLVNNVILFCFCLYFSVPLFVCSDIASNFGPLSIYSIISCVRLQLCTIYSENLLAFGSNILSAQWFL